MSNDTQYYLYFMEDLKMENQVKENVMIDEFGNILDARLEEELNNLCVDAVDDVVVHAIEEPIVPENPSTLKTVGKVTGAAAVAGAALYGVYKFGEWAYGKICEAIDKHKAKKVEEENAKKQKEEVKDNAIDVDCTEVKESEE